MNDRQAVAFVMGALASVPTSLDLKNFKEVELLAHLAVDAVRASDARQEQKKA
jgi:hypothetical protein